MDDDFKLSAYDYNLPEEHIAQQPVEHRDQSRLLILNSQSEDLVHTRFRSILDYLRPGDLLVRNDTKVFPARLFGKKETGGRVEMLFLEYPGSGIQEDAHSGWHRAKALVLIKASKRPKPGTKLLFHHNMQAEVVRICEGGKVEVEFHYRLNNNDSLNDLLGRYGQVPLPPYIRRPQGTTSQDRHRYQTRYAKTTGSVAAPTAGLHFSDSLLTAINRKGIESCSVTLHVGYGTFAQVRVDNIKEHQLHQEYVEVSAETAKQINRAKTENRRIWAVGTTTVRTLEFAADTEGCVQPVSKQCGLFIYPGFRFQVVDNLITNFHLPQSSLLFLVAAMVGRKKLLTSYRKAIAHDYRFFSYGDAMAIIRKD